MDIKKLNLRVSGMFSNVNEVVQQLYLAEQSNYKFVISWSASCYKDEEKAGDPWLYYFKPCFNINVENTDSLPKLLGGTAVACSKDNVITPRLVEGRCNPLLLPKNRTAAHELITKYLKLTDAVQSEIDRFKELYFKGNIIGLHIRGVGRTHGGAVAQRNKHELENGIPFSTYFDSVNRVLEQHPESKILVCSDSAMVIKRVKQEYGNRVVTYDSTLSEFGEMHANHAQNKGMTFSKYKLGIDVIVEAYLLSETNNFIHGNSNVANFVLCKNPTLIHDYVYKD